MAYKLDYSKSQKLQLSNDAFFYITEEEEPLDESNIDEAKEVLSMFPNGFYVEENWEPVEDSGFIEATFVPYVEDVCDYDESCDFAKGIQYQIKWTDGTHIKLWCDNSNNGTREYKGEFEVYTNKYGNKCFQTGDFTKGKGCLFFMKHFSKRISK